MWSANGNPLWVRGVHGQRQRAAMAFVALAIAALAHGSDHLDLDEAAPASPPVAQAFRLAVVPRVDGDVLGDTAWAGVGAIEGFWQIRPDDGRPASQRTEVFVGFTQDALYIGFVGYDDDPSGIIVSDSRRDASLKDTDSFQVILDSFHDGQNGFVFGTNPSGLEYDGQVTKEGTGGFRSGGGGFNLNWDTAWEVKAAISEEGWSAEMEIPFKSLRYGAQDVQTWGINFQRNIRRNNEIAFWSPLPRQYDLFRVSRAGSIVDIEVPPQRNLKVTPYALGKSNGGSVASGGADADNEVGFDIKYSLTPSLTLDATYNTDFAQVEVDELQVNLDRFNLFLPEKRPFFLENAGQFAVGSPREVELFFSRRIGIGEGGEQIPIAAGVRVSGKIGARSNVGFLHMRSESVDGLAPRNDYAVARFSQELPNRSSVGAIIVNREGDGGLTGNGSDDYNRTYAVDGKWGIGENGEISGYLAKTDTPGLEAKDHAFRLRGDYSSETWSTGGSYTEVGGDFNPEVGFLARRDYRKVDFRVQRRYRPGDLWGLYEIRPQISYRGFWDFDGFYETGFVHVDQHWDWKSGLEIRAGVNFTHEGVKDPFEIVDGVTVGQGGYDHREAQLAFVTNRGAPLSLNLRARIGGFFGGDRVNLSPTIRYRVGETFNTELSWDYNNIDLPGGDFEVNLGRLRVTYSFTPRISLQGLLQYNDRDDVVAANVRFAWLRSANTGLYLVYNEVDERNALGKPRRELIIKYSHIFDVLR